MGLTPLDLSDIREIEQAGLKAGLPLMQRAGEAIARFVTRTIRPSGNILILVGPGNNGGDALVAAIRLKNEGYSLYVWMPVTTKLPSDAQEALKLWLDSGNPISTQLPETKPALVIDGIFGIGLNRPMQSPWQAAIDTINQWNVPVLAVDIPSGLEADTGSHLGRPIRATWTMSFIAPTRAICNQPGQSMAGQVLLESLGVER